MTTPYMKCLKLLNAKPVQPPNPFTAQQKNELADITNPAWAAFIDSIENDTEAPNTVIQSIINKWIDYDPFTSAEISNLKGSVCFDVTIPSTPEAFLYQYSMCFVPLSKGVVLQLVSFKVSHDGQGGVMLEHTPMMVRLGTSKHGAYRNAITAFITQLPRDYDSVTVMKKVLEFAKNYRHN